MKNVLTHSKKKKAFALVEKNQYQEAGKLYEQVCLVDRTDADAWFMLGTIYGKLKDSEKAVECYRKAIISRPNHALTYYNLAILLQEQGKIEEAVKFFQEAAQREQRVEIYARLGHNLVALGRFEEAVSCYRELHKLSPNEPGAHGNLGAILSALGYLEEAVAEYHLELQLNPANASMHDNLASAYCQQGKYAEAIASHRRALQIGPENANAHSNFLLTLHYLPRQNPEEIFAEHKKWADLHGRPSRVLPPCANNRDPDRRLRVGYVSPDFRTHSVAYFIEPLLAHHDHRAVEVVCYSGVVRPDATTARLRGLADEWREMIGLTYDQLADMIRADEIDILVDLAGHTGANGLRAFSYRPAPVQVTYLGYPDTTGLATMDYRLTDALADPEGQDAFCTEKLVRLPGCFLCYLPSPDSPPVAPLPAMTAGHITFGSFNNLAKINPDVVALWAELLRAIPTARLFLKNPSLGDTASRERYYGLFEAQGIARERIDMTARTPTLVEHLSLYNRMDIALDTFPYNGTTTTCEAMWMGVPVVSLTGNTHAGHVGASLLTSLGFPELIARTSAEYISCAQQLSRDLGKLAALRAGLRERLAGSPLCDGKAFAGKVEQAYRDMWRKWCVN